MSRLALDGVACVRGGRTLFEGLDLALGAGMATLVTGPNGAGKSSLIRIAAGLLDPGAGSIERDGDLALLAEAPALDRERTLGDALRWWAAIDGRADAADCALADVGLAALAGVPVGWLSTGQRKRAGLARVIASGAAIWLLDEPANGLDSASVAMLEGLVARHRAGGGIVLVATHLPIVVPDAVEVRL
ncbi:heme ABC exporter ATP-binding protein CcmA [Sphingomonas sp.]|uniref:heme ABC exporter ATP-binding protein CcmA n=1 Tax=Sphingomonas sp. TaxID=28214 RepID=UPI002DD6A95D|nr:heme ABC exporter ATP-binding protein CcmA [Sphingomonas sp.]